MFKYSTSTILNDLVDANGVAKTAYVSTNGKESLTIHRLGKFSKANVTKIYKREGTTGTPGYAELKCAVNTEISSVAGKPANTANGVYRLNLYVKLSGNNDAYYANDFVFKGKPYAYEFEIKDGKYKDELGKWQTGSNAVAVAKAIVSAIKRMASRFNDISFKIYKTGPGADGKFAAANEIKKSSDITTQDTLFITTAGADNVYRNITVCDLQKFDADIDTALVGGEYVTFAYGTPVPCVNPFGTYGQIIKDLRLPTPEHTGWTSLMSDEMPVAGTVYDQYMIYMCVDRGVMGGDAVGQAVKSVTAHSLWVPNTLEGEVVADVEGVPTTTTLADAIESLISGGPVEYDKEQLGNDTEDAAASKTAFEDKDASEKDLAK